ncbi:MAG: hypothetical protein ACP5H9_04590 [Candidatus Woesearchaeota archaeon]
MRIFDLKNGELSIQIIFAVVIVVISIMFLTALFSRNLTGFAREIYCKTVFYVHSSVFIPKTFRQDSQFCKYEGAFETRTIKPKEIFLERFDDGSMFKMLNFSDSKKQNLTFNIKPEKIRELALNFSSEANISFSISFCKKTNHIKVIDNVESQIMLKKSDFEECNATNLILELNSSSGTLLVKNPRIAYEECFLEQELLAHILACWDKTKKGSYAKNIICFQIVVPKFCEDEKTSESSITRVIKEQGLCYIIGNNDYGCGEEDNIEYNLKLITSRTNIMIEYDAEKKKIIVS